MRSLRPLGSTLYAALRKHDPRSWDKESDSSILEVMCAYTRIRRTRHGDGQRVEILFINAYLS